MSRAADESRAAARRRLASEFLDAGIESADIDARLLVCAAAGLDHAGLIRDPDMVLGPVAADRLASLAERRLAREPVSRILAHRSFWGLHFAISPSVLDPRPETEGLVASVLDAIGGRRMASLSILDLGVGSGAILAALLSELPDARGVGIDRSEAACRVAHSNLAALGLGGRAMIVCADWDQAIDGRFNLVVSNPPYVTTAELAGLDREVREYDPSGALDGGFDGLDAYRAIVPRLGALLGPNGVAAFECGTGQGAAIAALIRDGGFESAMVYKDLAGHDRIVIAACAV